MIYLEFSNILSKGSPHN